MISTPGGATEPQRIFYICSDCYDADTETCGRNEPSDLRIMPNGRWLCDDCFGENDAYDIGVQYDADGEIGHKPEWRSLPIPPTYSSPSPDSKLEAYRKALEFYRDGFQFVPKRSSLGVNLSTWIPKEALLEDCGEVAKQALAAGG